MPPRRRSTQSRIEVVPRPEVQWRGSRAPPRPRALPEVMHLDLSRATARKVKELRMVDFEVWFPAERDPRASEGFYTLLQEDFYTAYQRMAIRDQRVCTLDAIVAAGGEAIQAMLTYLPGLADLLGHLGHYVESRVREFYASLWIDPGHRYIHFTFRGIDHRLQSGRARELLGVTESDTCLHYLFFGDSDPPRRPHAGVVPSVDDVRCIFRQPFGECSSRLPHDLTPTAHLLNDVVRRTLLPRMGYREGLTHM